MRNKKENASLGKPNKSDSESRRKRDSRPHGRSLRENA